MYTHGLKPQPGSPIPESKWHSLSIAINRIRTAKHYAATSRYLRRNKLTAYDLINYAALHESSITTAIPSVVTFIHTTRIVRSDIVPYALAAVGASSRSADHIIALYDILAKSRRRAILVAR